MILDRNHPYRKHSENLAAIKKALVQAERSHKDAIRRGDAPRTEFLARVHMFLVGLAAEAALRKTIADPAGFNERERTILRRERTQLERWELAIELAFRRHYGVPFHLDLASSALPTEVHSQLENLRSVLSNNLSALIEDRNKFAHGQWIWHMNSKDTGFTNPAPPPYNYLAIRARWKIIDLLGQLVYVLVVSEPTFQRDYEVLYKEIHELQNGLDGTGYSEFVKELKTRRGRSLS